MGAAKIAPARSAALRTLHGVRRGTFADWAFEPAARSLSPSDRRLAQELVYGVLRLRGRLDHLIGHLTARGLASLEPDVLDVLRLGAYQLMELDRVPAYAVISEAVEAAKRSSGPGAAALVNAVLRRLRREEPGSCLFPERDADPVGYLATWGSHPRWLIERWLERWSLADVERLVSYNNSRPAVYLTVVGPRDDALERLRSAGIAAEAVEQASASVRLLASGQVMQALELVGAIVQDPTAAAVIEYAALPRGVGVVDFCAAPGGKAALLAARGHEVWAFDISRSRQGRTVENRARLGLGHLHVGVANATEPPLRRAAAVLLDVPCTGTGTLARHPDGRWRLRPRDLQAAAQLQRRLLDASAEVVAPGGWLVYATCSLEPEENESQVEAFLARHSDFELDPPGVGAVPRDLFGTAGELRVLPHRQGWDGAYAARLRRGTG